MISSVSAFSKSPPAANWKGDSAGACSDFGIGGESGAAFCNSIIHGLIDVGLVYQTFNTRNLRTVARNLHQQDHRALQSYHLGSKLARAVPVAAPAVLDIRISSNAPLWDHFQQSEPLHPFLRGKSSFRVR